MHHGEDIAAPQGTPFYVPRDGIVQKVWPNGALSRYGHLLLVWVPEDRVTLVFAHLASPPHRADGTPWREGDVVRAGEQGGLIGYTGACRGSRSAHGVPCTPCGPGGRFLCSGPSGAHLHFEVRPGRVARPNPVGASLDPERFSVAKGFALHSGSTGVGALPRTDDPYAFTPDKYADPLGFEPGDDEPEPLSTAAKAGIAIGGAAIGFLLIRALVS